MVMLSAPMRILEYQLYIVCVGDFILFVACTKHSVNDGMC